MLMLMMMRGSGDGGDIQDRGGTNSNFLPAGTRRSKHHEYHHDEHEHEHGGDQDDDDDGGDRDDDDVEIHRSQVTHTSGVKCQ